MLEQSSSHMFACSQLSSHNIQLLYHHIDEYTRHHHHHSGSCIEHTSILCARAARKQTTTSGTATTYYYHHHTVQVTILRPPHAFLDGNDRHHHHPMVQVTMHAFSICAIALEKTPPLPPHSASYNIAATTTCASRVSALVGHGKRPPVQVTVAPGQHTHHSHRHMCQKVNALNG